MNRRPRKSLTSLSKRIDNRGDKKRESNKAIVIKRINSIETIRRNSIRTIRDSSMGKSKESSMIERRSSLTDRKVNPKKSDLISLLNKTRKHKILRNYIHQCKLLF